MAFFLIAFAASVIGGLCGIGGGVLMKPLIDMLHLADVAAASFLSGCTVFVMSLYNVGKGLRDTEDRIEVKTAVPLAIGAAAGGILGNKAFVALCTVFSKNAAGMAQSSFLAILTAATLLYTLRKKQIRPMHVSSRKSCGTIGLFLGLVSSFLGIGGGPFNLAILHFFFGMETKRAVANSLFIILLSQTTNLLSTVFTHKVPPVSPIIVGIMVIGGIGGGMLGRKLNKKWTAATVDRLFSALLLVIIGICIYNAIQYAALA